MAASIDPFAHVTDDQQYLAELSRIRFELEDLQRRAAERLPAGDFRTQILHATELHWQLLARISELRNLLRAKSEDTQSQ